MSRESKTGSALVPSASFRRPAEKVLIGRLLCSRKFISECAARDAQHGTRDECATRHAPRRILMTADTIGGVWTFALELARALHPHGTQIALATMGAPLSREQRDELSRLQNVQLFESRHKLEWMDDPWRDVDRAGDWLLKIAQHLQSDLIHLNGYAHAARAWDSPVLIVAHSCVLSWWRAVNGEPAPTHYAEYRRRVSLGLENASLVAVPTRAMLDSLSENYDADFCGGVIPNAREARLFQAAAQKQRVIFAAGRIWDEAKTSARSMRLRLSCRGRFASRATRGIQTARLFLSAKMFRHSENFPPPNSRANFLPQQFLLRPRVTSRSDSPRWKPDFAAVHLCSATSRACVKSGATRRFSSRLTISPRCAMR